MPVFSLLCIGLKRKAVRFLPYFPLAELLKVCDDILRCLRLLRLFEVKLLAFRLESGKVGVTGRRRPDCSTVDQQPGGDQTVVASCAGLLRQTAARRSAVFRWAAKGAKAQPG